MCLSAFFTSVIVDASRQTSRVHLRSVNDLQRPEPHLLYCDFQTFKSQFFSRVNRGICFLLKLFARRDVGIKMESRLSLCGPRFGSIDLHRHPCPCPAVVRSDHCQHNVFFFTPHISPDSLACQLQALFRLSRPSVLLDPTLPGSADLHTGMEFSRDKSFYHRRLS